MDEKIENQFIALMIKQSKNYFTLKRKLCKILFGSVANLTDRNKNYVDLLEGANLLYNETYEEENETDFLNR